MNADFFRVSSAFIPKSAPSASSFSVLLRTFVEHTLAAEQDLELMIPPEQVLTCCLLLFAD